MKKKKGRPSLSNLRKRNLDQQHQHQQQEEEEDETLISSNPNFNTPSRRSKPNNLNGISPVSDWISGDDDDERKEKKVKLVVRLPSLSLNNSASNGSDLNADGDKPQINDRSGDLSTADQVRITPFNLSVKVCCFKL